jgi:hypothetical protein
MKIEAMRFHGPGWTLDAGRVSYQVWGPQTEILRDEERFPGMWSTDGTGWHEDARPPRSEWAAAFHGPGELDGDYRSGELEEVLEAFPPAIAGKFKQTIEEVMSRG